MSSKWNPFNAVASGEYMINDVLEEKNKERMPVLSDDQKEEIQNRMFEAFNNQEVINVKYFKNGKFYVKEGKITNIDQNTHKIVVNEEFSVYFSQIIEFF